MNEICCVRCGSARWFEMGYAETGYLVLCQSCGYLASPEEFQRLEGWVAGYVHWEGLLVTVAVVLAMIVEREEMACL